MLTARLFEIGVFACLMLLLLLAALIGFQISFWFGLVAVIIVLIASIILIYNHDAWLVRRLSSDDNPLGVNLCRTGFVGRVRRVTRFLPADPRCRFCLVPFSGFGKILGIKPSSKNPNFCRSCFEALPARTVDLQVGVLFADIRGFTSWSESHAPSEAAQVVTLFYEIATRELTKDDAIVNYVGDQVMALYLTAMPSIGDNAPRIMLAAAQRLVERLRNNAEALPAGVGLSFGTAQVGSLAMGEAKDFTAIGDVVNIAARLQAAAAPFEIIMTEEVYSRTLKVSNGGVLRKLNLKGKSQPVDAYVLPAP